MADSKKTSAEQKAPDDAKPVEKPAAKSGPAKAPAKKPTTKKPATKAAPKKEVVKDAAAEQHVEDVAPAEPEAPAPAPQEDVAPAAEQPEQTAAQQPVEPEAPAPAPEPAPAPAPAAVKRSDAFANKSNAVIGKIKFPLWIVANALLLLSSIFLVIGSFSISYNILGQKGTTTCSLFQYLGNKDTLITIWRGTAGEWAGGGYAMVGILMFLSFLVPLALIVKNVVFFILKKDKEVHMFDAIVTFAFLIAYLGVVNMYGANMTWAHILSLIMAIILLAYTIFVILIENRNGAFPFFSIANIIMVMLCMFLLTSNKIYSAPGWYGAHAAAFSGGGGFAFILLLIALAALVLLLVMQVKKLPGKIADLFEFIVPAVAGGCALIALISFAGGKPDGLGMGGGFVFGAILTLLFAAVDVVFALVPKLRRYNVKVTDRMSGQKPAPVAAQSVEQPAAQPEQEIDAAADPVAEKAPESATVTCVCGKDNDANAVFCRYCGRKLK